jgi:hypothetical protein
MQFDLDTVITAAKDAIGDHGEVWLDGPVVEITWQGYGRIEIAPTPTGAKYRLWGIGSDLSFDVITDWDNVGWKVLNSEIWPRACEEINRQFDKYQRLAAFNA